MKKILYVLGLIFAFPLMLMIGAVTHNTNTLETLPNENKEFYDRELLRRCLPELVFQRYGQKRPLPKHGGDTINFRKFESLPAVTTALTEGVTPAGRALSMSVVKGTVKQYGDFVTTTDKIDMVGIDPVVAEAATLCGEQAGHSADTITRDIVCAGTNVLYANGVSTSEVAADNIMTAALIKKGVRALRRQNIKPIIQNKYFPLICHVDVSSDIMEDPLWQHFNVHNGNEKLEEGVVGKLYGAMIIDTTNALVKDGAGAGGADVYCSMLIGSDAYGVVDVEGSGKPKIIIKPLGSGGTEDPLDQRATVGWKLMFTAVRLNELAMLRIETGATA